MSDKQVIEGLQKLQADATVFYQKTRHYHWHVKGPHFFELHTKFEEFYTLWAEMIDEIAERIVTMGQEALPTLGICLKEAKLKENEKTPEPVKMVKHLAEDLEYLIASARKVKVAAGENSDDATENLMDNILDEEKNLWMLQAFLRK